MVRGEAMLPREEQDMREAEHKAAALQRIFLTGLSGVGKTTLGQRTASLLGWSFIDTDDVLAQRMGMPVGQVLLEYGEERFRQLESEALYEQAKETRVVIATGGGIVILAANRQFMRQHGLTVYLRASVETVWKHLQESDGKTLRPLIAGEHGQQRLRDLYTTRRAWYEEAALHLDTEEGPQDLLAQRLIAQARALGYLL
ncbi:MAG TPA: shikimate kinase [Ktedonobacteraceae bacterium]|nr:shikimate kinase [Ktedonobacteraceae bacterium]